MESIIYTLNCDDVEVVFTYQKGEQTTHDYPGSENDVEIEEIIYRGIDIIDIISESDLDEIKTKIHETKA